MQITAFSTLVVSSLGSLLLTGLYYPATNPTAIKSVLREGGNVMQPPDPGNNIIMCGGILNDNPAYWEVTRIGVKKDAQFKVVGEISPARQGATLIFSIIYGTNPIFAEGQGLALNPPEPWVVTANATSTRFVITRSIPVAYNYPATIQVEYRLSYNMSWYQCIDINVTGGLAYPTGVTQIDQGTNGTQVVLKRNTLFLQENPTLLTQFQIVLITLCILLLLCICCLLTYLICHRRKQKPADLAEEPHMADEHRPLAKNGPPVAPEAPEEVPPDEESEKEAEEAGTAGRHFHFRYVDEGTGTGERPKGGTK